MIRANYLNEGTILYVILITHKDEKFYKLGVTNNSVKSRFAGGIVPYEYTIVYEQRFFNARPFEQLFHETYSKQAYKPKFTFGGSTECYLFNPVLFFETQDKTITIAKPLFNYNTHEDTLKTITTNEHGVIRNSKLDWKVIIDRRREEMCVAHKWDSIKVRNYCALTNYKMKAYWNSRNLNKKIRTLECLKEAIKFIENDSLEFTNDNIITISGLSIATIIRYKKILN